MRKRLPHLILFAILLLIEIAIGMWATGFVRAYIGDVLVIPAIYFLLRGTVFPKDTIFSRNALPLIVYCIGWNAERLQGWGLADKLGFAPDSLPAILIGGTCDYKDILCYLLGLLLTCAILAILSKENKWYPLTTALQWTWGNMQTVAGFVLYLWYIRCPHTYYNGTILTTCPPSFWGISLGQFIFVPDVPNKEEYEVHEYGHALQSLLLGPLYIFVIGIPSISWGRIPCFIKMRQQKNIRYTSFYCEKWASDWGEKVTGKKAIRY